MTEQWVVLLNNGDTVMAYGPLGPGEALAFAEFMTKTVDPAVAVRLHSAAAEVLAWWQSETERNNCTHGPGCEVHPGQQRLVCLATGPHGFPEFGKPEIKEK